MKPDIDLKDYVVMLLRQVGRSSDIILGLDDDALLDLAVDLEEELNNY